MASKRHYTVTLSVPEALLGTVLDTVADRRLELISVVVQKQPEVSEPAEPRAARSGYVGGKRNKGISASELILQTLRENAPMPVRYAALTELFVSRGFAGNSVGPPLSQLTRSGIVRALGDGKYTIGTLEGTQP